MLFVLLCLLLAGFFFSACFICELAVMWRVLNSWLRQICLIWVNLWGKGIRIGNETKLNETLKIAKRAVK